MRCRATQEYSGGSSSEGKVGPKGIGVGGTFRHWSKFSTVNGVKYLYFLKEATTTTSSILPVSLEQTVKDYMVSDGHTVRCQGKGSVRRGCAFASGRRQCTPRRLLRLLDAKGWRSSRSRNSR